MPIIDKIVLSFGLNIFVFSGNQLTRMCAFIDRYDKHVIITYTYYTEHRIQEKVLLKYKIIVFIKIISFRMICVKPLVIRSIL